MALEELLDSTILKHWDSFNILDDLKELTEVDCILCNDEIVIPIYDPLGKGPYCCQECMEMDYFILSIQIKELQEKENQLYDYN